MFDHRQSLHVFAPPYTRLTVISPSWKPKVLPPKGAFLVWKPSQASQNDPALVLLKNPPIGVDALVILPPPNDPVLVADVVSVLPEIRPLYVLPDALSDARRLRQLLRQPPESFTEEFIEYLYSRGLLVEDRTLEEVRNLVAAVPNVKSVNSLARRLCSSRRTLGRHFEKSGIPSPSHWLQFVRLLHVVFAMQKTGLPLARASARAGYPDPFTCSNQMKRLIGVRPSDVKGKLGWRWFVECWIQQETQRGGFNIARYHRSLECYL